MSDIPSSPLLIHSIKFVPRWLRNAFVGISILAFVNMWIILHVIHHINVEVRDSPEPVEMIFSSWVRAVESLAILRALINLATPVAFQIMKKFEISKFFLLGLGLLIIVISISLIAILGIQVHHIHLEKKEFPEDQVFTPHWMGGMIAISSIDTLMVAVSMGMWWRLEKPKTAISENFVTVYIIGHQ
jgi:hypothetical protein